uniref:Peptidase S8/S53 domain-containing protein n=1 Tax=uncultured Armatimonadetes bacterium TaxID=157466 RepID=A0A6J4JXL6_9BACT|nr:hypothetical protein AVDCRST_MAG63-4302 [uncultured Armatimonadetes bacterium]
MHYRTRNIVAGTVAPYSCLHGWRTSAWMAFLLLALAGSAVSVARADALDDKSDRFLSRKMAARPVSGWSSVILWLGDGRQLTSKQREQIRSLGGYVYRHLPVVDSVAARVPNRNVSRLAALPFVRRLSADVTVRKTDEFTVASSGADVAFSRYRLTGAGVAVAVVDSGIRESVDLARNNKSRVVARVDYVAGIGAAGNDGYGHGTHVAGIIAGNGAGSTGPNYHRTFYGIARKADLVDLRVLDATGQGPVSDVVKAIDWVVANKDVYNIRVMNLSLGHEVGESYTTDPLCRAVEAAWKAGVVVVCAAGNEGRLQPIALPLLLNNDGYGTAYGSILSPANSPYVITVGAMKSTAGGRAGDRIGSYSGRGPSRLDFVLKPDIVAPGDGVISVNAPGSYVDGAVGSTNRVSWTEFCYEYGNPADASRYFRLSGTSMAAPVVSGAVALMLESDPRLSPDTVKARLMFSADRWAFPDGRADPCTFGAGYLNLPAALAQTAVATRYAVSPVLSRGVTGEVTLVADVGPLGLWGTGVDGTHIMWGSKSSRPSWHDDSLWGSPLWSDNAVWSVINAGVDLSPIVIHGDDD